MKPKLSKAYLKAQNAMSDMKSAIHLLLSECPEGLTNAQIGRALGIYSGHIGHEGHISRTLLAKMEEEGVVEQADDKIWKIKSI